MNNFIEGKQMYKLLTMLIILLGKLRSKFGNRKVRFDRTMPLPESQNKQGILYMECCDCGLVHFIVYGHSGTPIRPEHYDYGMRCGNKASSEPEKMLKEHVYKKWGNFKYNS